MTARGLAAKPRSGRGGRRASIHRVWAAPDADAGSGRQVSTGITQRTGSDARPSAAPSRAPAMAALVSVSPPLADGFDQRGLHRRARRQMKERVLQGDQHPAHLVLEIRGGNAGGGLSQRAATGAASAPAASAIRSAVSIMPRRSAPASAAEMAAAKAAQAARQTGCGWDSAESSLADRAPPRRDRRPRRRSARCASATRCSGCRGRRGCEQPEPCPPRPSPRRRTPAGGDAAIERLARVPTSVGRGGVFRVVIGPSAPGCVPTSGPVRNHPSAAPPTSATPGWPPDCAPRADSRPDRLGALEFHLGAQAVADHQPQHAAQARGRTAGPPLPAASPALPSPPAAVPCCRAMSARPQRRDRGRCAAEAGERAAVAVLVVGHRHAVLGHQDAAGGGQQRVAGGDVVRVDRAQGDGGDAVADRDPGQAVGDRGQRHEPGRRAGGAVPDRPLAGAVVQEHDVGRRPDRGGSGRSRRRPPLRVMARLRPRRSGRGRDPGWSGHRPRPAPGCPGAAARPRSALPRRPSRNARVPSCGSTTQQ